MVYVVCKCANMIEEFRYRFLDGKIVLFDQIDTAFTYLNKDTELFKVVNVPMQDTMQHHYLIGVNIGKETEESLCLFLYRHTIPLLMEYTLEI